jgi:hypothetical protein
MTDWNYVWLNSKKKIEVEKFFAGYEVSSSETILSRIFTMESAKVAKFSFEFTHRLRLIGCNEFLEELITLDLIDYGKDVR